MVGFCTFRKSAIITNPCFSIIATYPTMCNSCCKAWVLLIPNFNLFSRDKECVANHMRTVENMLHKVV